MYRVFTQSGYIISIARVENDGNITEQDYQAVRRAIDSKPAAPQGFIYLLREDLVWELHQLPQPTGEEVDE